MMDLFSLLPCDHGSQEKEMDVVSCTGADD